MVMILSSLRIQVLDNPRRRRLVILQVLQVVDGRLLWTRSSKYYSGGFRVSVLLELLVPLLASCSSR